MQVKMYAVLVCLCLGCVSVVGAETETRSSHLRDLIQQHIAGKPRDVWMFPRTPPQIGLEEFMPFMTKLGEQSKIINSLLQQYGNVSPLAKRITERFHSRIITTIDVGGFTRGGGIEALPQDTSQLMEIVFIPQDQIRQHQYLMYYHMNWQAVMIGALIWPNSAFATVIFHGLARALTHKEGGAIAALGASGEEVDIVFYNLEMDVLNAAMKGKLTVLLDAFLADNRGAAGWEELFSRLTAADLRAFEESAGCQACGSTVAQVMLPKYLLGIGFRRIEQTTPDESQRMARKVEFRRWLDQAILIKRQK